MVDFESKQRYNIDDLLEIVSFLRSENGCPWDREQTHSSLRDNMIEEATEAIEALDSGDVAHFKEELGDVLIQVLLHAQIASENSDFTFADIVDTTSKKLLRRHPHVFGDSVATTPEQSQELWNKIKESEKSTTTTLHRS